MTVDYLMNINDSLSDDTPPFDLWNKVLIKIMFDCLLLTSGACNIKIKHISYEHKIWFIPHNKTDQAGQGSYPPLSQI